MKKTSSSIINLPSFIHQIYKFDELKVIAKIRVIFIGKITQFLINKFEGKINYQQKIIEEFLNLEKIIGNFFDNVIVNHENNNLKSNRLALLNKLSKNITRFAKFEMIAD